VADLAEVDKVIIAQDSIQRFINSVSPGAYASITKVDFNALDQFMIKPLGVYGSKDEIVRLLQCMGAIDDNAYGNLCLLISCFKFNLVYLPPPILAILDRFCPLVCT
jgi:hypothetical protein